MLYTIFHDLAKNFISLTLGITLGKKSFIIGPIISANSFLSKIIFCKVLNSYLAAKLIIKIMNYEKGI